MKILVLLLSILFLQPSAYAQKRINGETELKNLFIDLGKMVNPAVVNIFTTQVIRNPYGGGQFRGMPMDPFQQFMEEFMGGGQMYQREQKASSLGSGFIIEDTGLIVTNNHVIQNATDIQVQLTEKSKKTYKAKVIGKDERTDIALIKIDYPGKLTYLILGDSDKVQVGEWVAAFGNPFGHGHTMTKGIISAKEREIQDEAQAAPAFPFLQTDASINPGNSGGPLVNASGEVVGVNSAIDARAQGIGFAIPINVVKRFLPELKSKGKITRGYLGVTVVNINEQIIKEFKLKTDKGAFVMGVNVGSPADHAGLQPYDVVVEINGKEVEDARDMTNKVGSAKVGDVINLKMIRDGAPVKIAVKIQERNDKALAHAQQRIAPKGASTPIGIEIADLNPALNAQIGLPGHLRGVMIINVKNNSVADQAGLQTGDIILDVNKKHVANVKEALKLFKKSSNSLRISRGGQVLLFFMDSD